MSEQPTEPTSLATPQARGGAVGAGGYAFQEAYLVTQLPAWLADEAFCSFLLEGAGDVDILFQREGSEEHWYTQVKDHPVTPQEFRDVLAEFAAKDAGSPGTFSAFTLASPGLSSDVRSFCQAVNEYRGALGMYDAERHPIMTSTRDKLGSHARRLGIQVDIGFLVDKLHFDPSVPLLNYESISRDLFVARIQKIELWSDTGRAGLDMAYDSVAAFVRSSIRKTRTRAELEALISAAIERARTAAAEAATVVQLHTWTEPPAGCGSDHVLDWSEHFDRATRRVPSPAVWDGELLPSLAGLREAMLSSGASKLVRLRGSNCLSAGIAFGHAFPEVGGYFIELEQRRQMWRSDQPPAAEYEPVVVAEDGNDPQSDDLVVLLSVTGDIAPRVQEYLGAAGLRYRAQVTVSPPNRPGEYSLQTAAQAVALASCTKAAIRRARDTYGAVGVAHVFLFGPLGLAVFLGQKLSAVGQIRCYEYQDPGYVPSCLLRT